MANMDELRAKQEELSHTEQELRNVKENLINKEKELESARLENENKKTELINQLISEIGPLKERAEIYEQQITLIRTQVDELQKRLDSTQQTIMEPVSTQPTVESDPVPSTTESVSTQSTVESTSVSSTTESVSTQSTVESTSVSSTTESVSTQPTVESDSVSSTTESVSTQSTVESTSEQSDNQQSNQPDIKLDSYEGYDKALSQLIFEIEGCAKTANYSKGLNKSGKETLKTAKAKLKEYKDIMNNKRKMLKHELKEKNKLNNKNPDKAPLTLSISKAEINELKNRRFERRKQIEVDIKEGQSGKSSNTAPRPNQSLEQVKKGNKVDRHHIEYDSKLNEALKDVAFLRTIDNNQDRAKEFLQAIENNSLSDTQITVCQTHMAQLAPYFEQYGLTDQVHKCIQTRGGRYTQSVATYGNMDGETAYRTGGAIGWLNNTLIKAFPNAKPNQVSNLTNVAVAAGGIYAIYRIGKWFFGKNEKGERNLGLKITGLAGLYFAPQLLLGKDGFSLLGEILSGKANFGELGYRLSNCLWFLNNGDKEVYSQMAPGILGMSIFPQNYTVKDLRALQQTFSDQNTRRQWYTATYNRLNKDNSALANEFKNTFNANQYNENERKVFLAKLGITENTSDDTIIFNETSKLTDKKTSLELWMKSQGKKKNPAFEKEIDEYLKQEGEFNPDNLDQNWFIEDKEASYSERQVDKDFKTNMENKIDSLPIDEPKKSELKTAFIRFYDERNIEAKPIIDDFSLTMENGFLILTSHKGQKTKINIKSNEIDGFGRSITFSNLSELLNIADLSNKIIDITKTKTPKGMPIFQSKTGTGGRGIYFNDADTRSFDFDTRVLSGGWGGTIGKIDTLSNHSQEYAEYLSKRRIENKKIDVSSYLTLKNLGITFIDKDEAEKSEELLKYIKHELRMYEKRDVGTAFEISTEITTKTNIKFFTRGGKTKEFNISDYPTFINNKDKLLKYLNNPFNKMRQSERPV